MGVTERLTNLSQLGAVVNTQFKPRHTRYGRCNPLSDCNEQLLIITSDTGRQDARYTILQTLYTPAQQLLKQLLQQYPNVLLA